MKLLSCACLPDEKSSLKIQGISEELSKKCNSKNALAFPPHFSIRGDFKISEKNIPRMIKEIESLCEKTNLPKLEITKYNSYPWRLVFLDIQKNKALQELHNECMETISKYKDTWIPQQYSNNNNFKGKQKAYIEQHGYHFCFEFFSPHFTVVGNDMSEQMFQKIKEELRDKNESLEIEVKSLIFFDREDNNKTLIEIPLKSNANI